MEPSTEFLQKRQHCIKTGRAWEDPNFPAADQSLFFTEPPCKFIWRRPSDIAGELNLPAELFVGGADRFDLMQGAAGNCWVISGASALAERPAILNKVLPPGQTVNPADSHYCGILRFYFWRYGVWEEVLIDDRLPWVQGMTHLAFVHSKTPNEFWGALLEKAYAKLHGSYESLTGGSICDSLTDFTGGICESYDISDHRDKLDRLWKIIYQSNKKGAVIGAGINQDEGGGQGGAFEGIRENGLVTGHAYSVTDAKEISDFVRDSRSPPTRVRLVRVRNPWGNDIEWKGDWSDSSPLWKLLTPQQTQEVLGFAEDVEAPDGEFFMPFDEFVANFDNIDICNMNPEESNNTDQKAWTVATYEGKWTNGFNAGGSCMEPTHWTNPQYKVIVEDADDDDDTGTLIVQLLQKDKRKEKHQMHQVKEIGFFIYKQLEGYPFPLPKKFFTEVGQWKKKSSKKTAGTAAKCAYFAPKRQNVCRFELDPGPYVVIPCCWDPDLEAEFMLRIFSETDCGQPELDSETKRLDDVQLCLQPVSPADSRAFKQYFQMMAGEDMAMDAFELLAAINTLLNADKNFKPFSVDACRQMVNLFDADASGKLDIDEFHKVVQHVRAYQTIFHAFDTDGSGTMSTYELRPAIEAMGYQLHEKVLKTILFQHANEENEVTQDTFIIMAIKLKTLFDAFDSHSKEGILTVNLGSFVSICSKM